MLELLSRIQFASTVAFHFIFVPLTIGLILLIAIFETLHLKKKEDQYRKLADYFGNLFIINYAVGIVTGIAMSLQLGTNWGAYSAFMGDVFGPPLALEALIAFFLESTFTGIYVFRRKKLSPKFRTIVAWLITLGTSISALWIITASGFMQNPVGYEMASDGSKVILTSIWAVLTNPYAWYMLIHTVASAMLLGGFFVLAVTSYKLLKNDISQEERTAFEGASKIAAIVSFITSLIVPIIGGSYFGYIAKVQPSKIAAIGGEMPIVKISFFLMVGIGTILILISLYTIVFHKRYLRSIAIKKIFKYVFVLTYIAILAGWIVTEVGRQPWLVFNLLKTADGISQVPVASVAFTLVTISLLYLATFILFIHLMKTQLRKNLDDFKYEYQAKEGK